MNEWIEYLNQFHFLRPFWLLGMLPLTAVVILLWKRKAAYGSWERVISPHLLPHLMGGGQTTQSRSPLVLLLVAWLLATIALAGPTWRQLPQAAQKKINAQVIVLDLSLSMFATDLPPSRLLRARMKLTDILKHTHEGLTALVVYAGTAHAVTPLTDDTNTILSMVNSLSPDIMPIKGSDPIEAVKKALQVFKQGGISQGRILLMTDNVPADFVARIDPLLTAGTPLSILGIGTPEGAPIELPDGTFVKAADGNIVVPRLSIDTLKQAARHLGGRFSTLSATDEDINYLLADTSLLGGNEIKDAHREFDVWDESGPWLVALLLPFAAAGYRRGWLGALLLPMLFSLALMATPRPASAFGWDDLWQTPDQQGQALLREGNPKAAAETFAKPGWKGTSYYKDGNYEAAAAAFSQQASPDSHYNLGNALARQQKYDEAIAAYEQALKQTPNDKDAQFNLDLVQKLQQQQKDQDNQQDDDNKKKSDQNKQDQQQQDKKNQDQNDQNQDQKDQDQQNKDQNQDKSKQQQDQQDDQDKQQNQQDQQQSEQKDQQDQKKPEPKPGEEQQDDKADQDQPPMPVQPQREPEKAENQQALEQWLRRIPDDPGGLLRRKFEQESQLRKTPPGGESTW